jgi:hypothetical protein
VSAWTAKVEDPFRSDPRFWRAVGLSVDALLTMFVAAALVAVFGAPAVVAFIVPGALLVLAARDGRVSSAATRPMFDGRVAWRDAERRAVAAALPRAVVRPRLGRGA